MFIVRRDVSDVDVVTCTILRMYYYYESKVVVSLVGLIRYQYVR